MFETDLMIFDLDGTLVDTRVDLANAVNHAIRGLGLPEQSTETIIQNVGNGLLRLIKSTLPDDRQEEVEEGVALFREHYKVHLLDNSRLYAGIPEVLAHFSEKKMAIISNKPEQFCKQIIAGLGLASQFQMVLGGDSLPEFKPSPLPLRHVLKEMRVSPGKCVMIGDSPMDIQAGIDAETLTCAAAYGYRSRKSLIDLKPNVLIDHPNDLLSHFL